MISAITTMIVMTRVTRDDGDDGRRALLHYFFFFRVHAFSPGLPSVSRVFGSRHEC